MSASTQLYSYVKKINLDGFWVVGKDLRIKDVNHTYSKFSGYPKEELKGRLIEEIGLLDDVARVEERFEKIRRNGYDRYEVKHLSKNGDWIDIEISASYQPDHGGEYILFLRDITEKKFFRDKIEKERDQLLSMINGIDEIIYISDPES